MRQCMFFYLGWRCRESDARFDPRDIQLRPPLTVAAGSPDPAASHTVGELAESYVKHQRETEAWKKGRVASITSSRFGLTTERNDSMLDSKL